MHQWIDPGPVAEPVGLGVRQPKAGRAAPPCIDTDAGHPWIEPDTMHQWVDPGPVAKAMGPEVRQPKAGGAVPPCIQTDASHPWIECPVNKP